MTINFYPYQEECIESIRKTFECEDTQMVQLPTGSGKTFIFLKYLQKHSKSSLIIVPTKDLAEQIKENSFHFFSDSQVFKKERDRMRRADHYIVTAQSLNFGFFKNWVKDKKFDHIIIDEAHRSYSKTHMSFLEYYRDLGNRPKLLGLTATPERLDKKPLLEIFGEISYKQTIYDLISQGFLCDIEAIRIRTNYDLKADKTETKDIPKSILHLMDNESRNKVIVGTYKKHCVKSKTLIFCVSIKHCETLANSFRSLGYSCEAIHGSMTFNRRREILREFKSGKIQVLCNCQLLTEGFDEPSIESVIMARPTKSKALYCQMIGRVVRNFPGKRVGRVYELTDNNHNICNFSTAAYEKLIEPKEYKGTKRLSQFHKELIEFDITEKDLVEEKYNILNRSSMELEQMLAFDEQKEQLKHHDITFFEPITFFEACFLLWKKNKLREYGYYKRK